ncbi:conserved hypothetical protein [Hydrogenobacter thermophilus TK-6]|uniref:Uncharacterized protein n=1 Tax=Hydrogenobacter thermophilus (strain DSM 6534 / IAM 12695 / TK-6) TaxID=608538 RepID=D3DFY9_HYDTT|nr:hypothetical protein [Hydrogenobacter thermophilus]ADO44677.1 conserved hypothetical protein [Hydrogenobacter thermophilus TK-6]BAI68741.1 hypothetical protein HTH_0274 [Hydrogenobacter thermophilus TK-6]
MAQKEELKPESLEQEVEELRKSVFKLLELFLPPKDVRKEIMKNLYTAELSLLKVFKTLLDYKVSQIERKIEEKEEKKRERVKKVEVE